MGARAIGVLEPRQNSVDCRTDAYSLPGNYAPIHDTAIREEQGANLLSNGIKRNPKSGLFESDTRLHVFFIETHVHFTSRRVFFGLFFQPHLLLFQQRIA